MSQNDNNNVNTYGKNKHITVKKNVAVIDTQT